MRAHFLFVPSSVALIVKVQSRPPKSSIYTSMADVAVCIYRQEQRQQQICAHQDRLSFDVMPTAAELLQHEEEANPSLPPLPKPFLRYLAESGVDPSIYSAAQTLPRYVRIKPGFEKEVPQIEAELGHKLVPIAWLPGFFSLPPESHIAGSEAYRVGKIYGIDAASGAAVQALGVSPSDHILDLCAAPGAKFCMIADRLGTSGTLTGVDISRHRLAATRTMLLKYGLGDCCRLFVSDGTTFGLLPTVKKQEKFHQHEMIDISCEASHDVSTLSKVNLNHNVFGEWTSRKTRKEKKILARRAKLKLTNKDSLVNDKPELLFYGRESGVVGLPKMSLFANSFKDGESTSEQGYDKVLVDAECTHDGSLKHICKYEQWGWDTLERRVLDQDRLASITTLQLQLLINGFRLMKVGGTLLYSTCSFTIAQNEGVIERFLATCANAELVEIEDAKQYQWPCKNGQVKHTLRFDPICSETSGLFLAKIRKRPVETETS